jgi:hypothetical protein
MASTFQLPTFQLPTFQSPTLQSPTFQSVMRRAAVAVTLCAAMAGLATSPAHARVFIGIGFPFYGPAYYPPVPYYYPPPVYYAPPPVQYAPPPGQYSQAPPPRQYSQAPAQGGAGQTCNAGPYVCPMDHPTAAGSTCYCLGSGGAHVWGRAS